MTAQSGCKHRQETDYEIITVIILIGASENTQNHQFITKEQRITYSFWPLLDCIHASVILFFISVMI